MLNRVLMVALLVFAPLSMASQFEAGKHYVEINGNQTKKPLVTEYFSFYCPACYRQEPFMNEIRSWLPKPEQFTKNHVDGMPGQTKAIEQMLTKALVTAERLKVKEQITAAIFDYIHVSKAKFTSESDVKKLFTKVGVKEGDFDKTFNSFSVKMALKKMSKNTQNLRNQGISGVPTLIINGKYKPVTSSLKSMDEYKQLIKYLITLTA